MPHFSAALLLLNGSVTPPVILAVLRFYCLLEMLCCETTWDIFTSLRCSKIHFRNDWHKLPSFFKGQFMQSVQVRSSWTINYNQKHFSLSIIAFVCLSHLSINSQCKTCDILNTRSLIVLREQSYSWVMYRMPLHLHWSTSSFQLLDLIL